jgi:uncharacterized glyoxalase superfamily protein PhnB
MTTPARFTAAAAGILLCHAALHAGSRPMTDTRLTQLTPVLVVDRVEPCIAFWVDRFGFKAENQVPGPDGRLVFASVAKDGVEVMYQTRASVVAEAPESAKDLDGHSVALFIVTEDLDAVERAVAGAPVVKPRHKTFYGTTELYVREPGGNTVGFSQRSSQ